MSPRLFTATVASAILLVLATAGPSEAQILRLRRSGLRVGPLGGVRLRAPGFSLRVSPLGGTRIRVPDRGPRLALPYPGPLDYRGPSPVVPWVAPGPATRPLPDPRVWPSSRYLAPQERYSTPQERYSLPQERYSSSRPRGSEPQNRYAEPASPRPVPSQGPAASQGPSASSDTAAPSEATDRARVGETNDPLPFARSPYDDDADAGFGVTGNAPAESLSDQELRTGLVRSANELDAALAAREDGEVWQDFLQPERIAEVFRSTDPTTADAAFLRRLWMNFEGTAGNEDLQWVIELDGFTATRSLLAEWLRRQSGDGDAAMPAETPEGAEAGPALAPPNNPQNDLLEEDEAVEAEPLPAPAPNPPQAEQRRRYEI